jgi:hypothetical protein
MAKINSVAIASAEARFKKRLENPQFQARYQSPNTKKKMVMANEENGGAAMTIMINAIQAAMFLSVRQRDANVDSAIVTRRSAVPAYNDSPERK